MALYFIENQLFACLCGLCLQKERRKEEPYSMPIQSCHVVAGK